MRTRDIEQWKLADAAFDALLDLPAAEREAALEALDLAEPVRQRVRRLLHAEGAGAALDLSEPVRDSVRRVFHGEDAVAGSAASTGDSFRGRRFGRWVVEREIGRGGMAVVFRAHDHDATAHLAAIKMLTLGALAGPGLERFRREQAILARLSHPHIATLLDSGVEPDGTPWLAMALVEGQPIDAWCEAQAIDLRGRVRLLLDVCEAVAHAHRALVVHRDLKPSNVLVDADGHVRLLDFGIARLTDDTLGDTTATHWRALSPQYAAPEQFEGAAATTVMDVFGLGALLYALLTGTAPRPTGRGEQPFEAPSRRALRAGGRRHLPSPTLLAGDLDAIVLHAMKDDPAARYVSVDALADDLRRWLAGAAVAARGAGAGYRLRRWLRRHWRMASMAAIALVSLLAGATIALDRAREAEAQAARAMAVQEFLLGIFQASQTDASGELLLSTREIAEDAARRLEAAERAGEGFDPALSLALARVLFDLGLDQQALQRTEAARARLGPATSGHALTIEAAVLLARLRRSRGAADEAESLLREALAAQPDDAPAATLPVRALLAIALYDQARIDEALALSDVVLAELDAGMDIAPTTVIDALLDRAVILRAAGRFDDAIAAARRAVDLTARTFGEDSPMLVRTLDLQGGLQRRSGRVLDALDSQRRALTLARRSAGTIKAVRLSNLARSLLLFGDAEQAAGVAAQALERRREEIGDDHPSLAETEEALVQAQAELGDTEPALAYYRRVLAERPSQPLSVFEARRRSAFARLLLHRGDVAAAEALYREAAGLEGSLFPHRVERATAQAGLACSALARADLPAADAAFAAAHAELPESALDLHDRILLATCEARRAQQAGRLDEAIARHARLDATLAPLLGDSSPRRARVWQAHAEFLDAAGRGDEAARWRERAKGVLAEGAR